MITENELEVLRIKQMGAIQLLSYAMECPEYLTDKYYWMFGEAVQERWKELQATKLDMPIAKDGRGAQNDVQYLEGLQMRLSQVSPEVGVVDAYDIDRLGTVIQGLRMIYVGKPTSDPDS